MFVWKSAADVTGDEGEEIGEREKLGVSADAVGRAGPDGVQNFVEEQAALEAVRPASAGSQPCAPRRAVAKALKGHCDCAVSVAAPPGASPGGKGSWLASSNATVSGRERAGRRDRRQRLRRAGELRDEPRRARFDAVALPRVAEVNFGRGGEQAARDGGGQIPNRDSARREAFRPRAAPRAEAADAWRRGPATRLRWRRGTRWRRR